MNILFGEINYAAVVIVAVANFAMGSLWYTIFAKPWMAELGLTKEIIAQRKKEARRGYAIVTVGSFAIAFALAFLVQLTDAASWRAGALVGLILGIGIVAINNGANYSFENRSLRIYLINTGYPVAAFVIMGIILAVWQ